MINDVLEKDIGIKTEARVSTNRLHFCRARKKSHPVVQDTLMSRIEHSCKNLLVNCFHNFGKKDLKETAIRNV